MRTLAPAVVAHARGVTVELHSHCNTGLGPLCALEAVKAGIMVVNTAIPPLADGASLPSIFNVAHHLRALGYTAAIDDASLRSVAKHFTVVAKREGFPIGAPVEYDETQYQHQVPGGMISNLGHQLAQVGKESKLEEALEETIRVRAELGYPIMVTPLSQFVGSQAAINVIVGERYKEVTDQVIRLALGQHGEEAVTLMDQNVRQKILDRPRAREIMAENPALPTLKELRAELGGPDVSDEDLLLRWLVNKEDVAIMKKTPPHGDYNSGRHPLVALVAELASRADSTLIEIKRPGFEVKLAKAGY